MSALLTAIDAAIVRLALAQTPADLDACRAEVRRLRKLVGSHV